MRYMIALCLIFCLLAPAVIADEDNFFSIRENFGPYKVEPGDEFEIGFVLSNRELLRPKDVAVYVENCPEAWTCERKTFSYEEKGYYNESILVSVPETALPKRYSLSLELESDYWTEGGDTLVLVSVLSEEQAGAISYEEYLERQAERERKVAGEPHAEPVQELPEDDIDDRYTKGLVENDVPVEVSGPEDVGVSSGPENDTSLTADVSEAVERLESDRQFVEYISIVLVVILVFILAGAFAARKKDKEK